MTKPLVKVGIYITPPGEVYVDCEWNPDIVDVENNRAGIPKPLLDIAKKSLEKTIEEWTFNAVSECELEAHK